MNETHPCWKCAGQGRIHNAHGGLAYPHRLGSLCYACNGAGTFPGAAPRTRRKVTKAATEVTVMTDAEMADYWASEPTF